MWMSKRNSLRKGALSTVLAAPVQPGMGTPKAAPAEERAQREAPAATGPEKKPGGFVTEVTEGSEENDGEVQGVQSADHVGAL